MKIGLVFEYPTLNGGEHSLLSGVDALSGDPLSAGLQFCAIGPAGPLAEECRQRGWHYQVARWHDDDGVRCSPEAIEASLAQFLHQQQPDLVHGNSLSVSRWLGRSNAAAPRPRTGHLRDIIRLNAAAIAELNRLDRLIAVSHATAAAHIAQGLDPARVEVVHNGVDLQRFSPPRDKSPGPDDGMMPAGPLVGALGQIGLRKGLDVLLDAFRLLLADVPTAQLQIGGERHSQKAESVAYAARLDEASSRPPLAGHVQWLGRVQQVPVWMNGLTLLVHAARQEPLGRVLIEGLACGLPIVATDVGGTREIIEHGVTGVLVPPGDPVALASAMRELLRDADRRQQLGRAARQSAEARFDAAVSAGKLWRIWQQVHAQHAR